MKILALLIATMLAAGISAFAARNPEIVHVDLLMGKVSITLSMALLGSAFLGAMVGGILVMLLKGDGKKSALREKNE